MATADFARDLAQALDPVCLAEAAGIFLDKWQRDVVRSRVPRQLLNCSRQSGKSTAGGILTLHTALYQPDSLILVLSPGERQSKEFLQRHVLNPYRALGRLVPADTETKLALELTNGSRIVALPGNN